ncbi:MAG: translation initiation factor IF-2 [Bacillota bacterium]
MTEKIRVYELAKEMLVDSKVIIRVLDQMDVPVKNHMSTMEAEVADQVREVLTGRAKMSPPPKKEIKKTPRPPVPAARPGPIRPVVQPGQAVRPKPVGPAVQKEQRRQPSRPISPPRPVQKPPGGRPGAPQARQSPHQPGRDERRQPGQKGGRFRQDQAEFARRGRGKKADWRKSKGTTGTQAAAKPKKPQKIVLEGSISVAKMADKMGLKATDLMRQLVSMGVMVSINQEIDTETAMVIGQEMGYEVEERRSDQAMEKEHLQEVEDSPENLKPRPPVVTVMGHVDHGKTSLLDAIRHANVTAQEAGGITQHIGAYTVDAGGRDVVFIDTPGHEAFTAMRARGAKVTDLAVLVVAADDGVMPQTIEAMNHAKAAGVPIIVAINKIDKPNTNVDRVKQQLSEHGLIPEDWGGDVVCVPVSAKEKTGLDTLLEMILLVSEMQDLKANPERRAAGIVVEAELDKGRGPVATVIVQTGTLKVGDAFVAGSVWGKVRAMMDHRARRVKKAGPSMPVEVIGMADVPEAGDPFNVVQDDKIARTIAEHRMVRQREKDLRAIHRLTLEDLFSQAGEGEIRELNLILKADVQGSVEAVKHALENVQHTEVRLAVIHTGVGAITESDVMLAAASQATIIGFNVRPDANARKAAEGEHVDIRTYRVIYEAIDDIKAALQGMLKPKTREVVLGRAEVRATFRVPKAGTVAGCYVTEGKMTRQGRVRVIRDGVVVHEGRMDSLKRFKEDVREVSADYECGISLEGFNEVKEGDTLEVFSTEEMKPEAMA